MSEKQWVSPAGISGAAYARATPDVLLQVEMDALGTTLGVRGYTTPAQAEALAEALELGPGMRLLDLGSGRGWLATMLAERFGCEAVLTDLPQEALRTAAERARAAGLAGSCYLARGHAAHLPFRPASFDAISHTDVFC